MTYIEQLFRMPIIIYDGKQLMRASKKEEDMDMDESLHVDSAISIMKLPIEEIVSYCQTWSRDSSIQEAQDGKFDSTLVMTHSLGDYLCAWSSEKFEKEYEKHTKKLIDYIKSKENHDNIALD